MKNPCQSPAARALFSKPKAHQWTILNKDAIDEAIYRTVHTRTRLMIELMARGGMRVSEVLGLRPIDICDGKLLLHEPKSGRETVLNLLCSSSRHEAFPITIYYK